MLLASVSPVVSAQTSSPVSLIIRTDDVGMSHSVNVAMQRLVSTGMPVSSQRFRRHSSRAEFGVEELSVGTGRGQYGRSIVGR
jgi:hypothetical protein